MLLLSGSGLTLFGGAISALGAFGEPTTRDDGTVSDPRTLLVPGLVTLGVGIAVTVIGALVMHHNRPVQQQGTTTSWTRDDSSLMR